jgi:CheY-like chemotaxis protein
MNKIKTILLVDDDSINNFINRKLLEKMEVAEEIKIVNNGEEGIKCLYDHCFETKMSPELILLDINMPVMDGFEFITTFNELQFQNKSEVTIAVLTTSSNPKDRDKMERLGVKNYLSKPLTEIKIREFLRSIKVNVN